jgi:hypothetical protein
VLGFAVTGLAGSEWTLTPQFGDLSFAEGGFSTSLGKFRAAWAVLDGGSGYNVTVSSPQGTTGTLLLPLLDNATEVSVSSDGESTEWAVGSVGKLMGYIQTVDGGDHTYIVQGA